MLGFFPIFMPMLGGDGGGPVSKQFIVGAHLGCLLLIGLFFLLHIISKRIAKKWDYKYQEDFFMIGVGFFGLALAFILILDFFMGFCPWLAGKLGF